MEKIITETANNFKYNCLEFFNEGKKSITEIESFIKDQIENISLAMTAAYYEELDQEILEDKKGRKKLGLIVERKGEERNVLTQIGMLSYRRTYYEKTGTDDVAYTYPVDKIAGITPYQRISTNVCADLISNAAHESYEKSSVHVTNGYVSKQTVMNKIRETSDLDLVKPERKRIVDVLHIDADEDHVSLQNGKNTIVPLISVYEGINKAGKRGSCKNIFHISRIKATPEELWEETLERIEEIYDISNTTIYLHGDGAPWIKEGLEWLPNCKYCLDKYHINKNYKKIVAGFNRNEKVSYLKRIKQSLANNDKEEFKEIIEEMLNTHSDLKASIIEAGKYLWNNFDAISIYKYDTEASNGGATEPHVSHILSSRLSSRPMGWSLQTLEKLVPILATGRFSFSSLTNQKAIQKSSNSPRKTTRKKNYTKNSLGVADPDISISMACARKNSSTFNMIKHYFE